MIELNLTQLLPVLTGFLGAVAGILGRPAYDRFRSNGTERETRTEVLAVLREMVIILTRIETKIDRP